MISRLKLLKGAAVGAVASLLLVGKAEAQTPTAAIHYQGRLTNPDGTPVGDGSWPVIFRLFGDPTGGTALWQESSSVTTRAGAFATMLGRNTTFPGGLFNQPLWLEIEVNTRKLTPRQELGAAPYAMTALNMPAGAITNTMIAVGSLTGDRIKDHTVTEQQLAPGLAVPIGGVLPWWGNAASPPDGWAICDGQTLSDSQSSLNGLALPDLRNKFIQGGTGDVRSSLPIGGRASMNLSHTHNVNAHTHDIPNDLNVGALKALGHHHSISGGWTGDESSNGKDGGFNGSGFLLMVNGNASQSYQSLGHNHGGQTGGSTPGTSVSLSEDQSIIPPYVGLIYIVRVR